MATLDELGDGRSVISIMLSSRVKRGIWVLPAETQIPRAAQDDNFHTGSATFRSTEAKPDFASVIRTSRQSLQESFGQYPYFFADGQTHLISKDVVALRRDLLQQAAINSDQNPQRGLTVFVHQRDQFLA